MAEITAELVSIERKLWEGKAVSVTAETTEGEIGVLPGHQPFLGQLSESGVVTIRTADGEVLVAAVPGGFISVSTTKISILANESTAWASEVDLANAESNLDSADAETKSLAQAQVRAVKRAGDVA